MYGVSFLERGNTFDDQFYHACKGIQMLLYNKMMPQNQVIDLSSTWLLLFVLHFVCSAILQFILHFLCFLECRHEHKIVWMHVCVCLPRFSLFASGPGMKGPGALVMEALADVSWPVGTRFSRIRLPSRAGFGSTLTCSHSVSCLNLPSPHSFVITPVPLSVSARLDSD